MVTKERHPIKEKQPTEVDTRLGNRNTENEGILGRYIKKARSYLKRENTNAIRNAIRGSSALSDSFMEGFERDLLKAVKEGRLEESITSEGKSKFQLLRESLDYNRVAGASFAVANKVFIAGATSLPFIALNSVLVALSPSILAGIAITAPFVVVYGLGGAYVFKEARHLWDVVMKKEHVRDGKWGFDDYFL